MQTLKEKQKTTYEDYEVSISKTSRPAASEGIAKMLFYVIAGILFGIILIKSEVVSWFRIQEMFRLQSFHMYGVI
jgi:hypothetical protein